MFLETIGADSRVYEQFRAHHAPDLQPGRISFAVREQYRVFLETGEVDAVPTGRLRYDDVLPAVGDWVAARRVDAGLALIEAVLPRRTQFSRRAPGTGASEQVIAANIDLALVVCGLDHDFNLRRIERYLVLARESGGEAVVVLNKRDLSPDLVSAVSAVEAIAAGVPVVAISARDSVAPLRPLLLGRTSALLGSSGAGKSTIVNALLEEVRQATQAVRAADSHGRHTTTSRMLLPLPGGGTLIDNPGMRELQLWANDASLEGAFGDISTLAEGCRFADCTHMVEPGCAVRGAIDPDRWHSYRKLQSELQRGTPEQKRKWKIIHKSIRHHPKYNR